MLIKSAISTQIIIVLPSLVVPPSPTLKYTINYNYDIVFYTVIYIEIFNSAITIIWEI